MRSAAMLVSAWLVAGGCTLPLQGTSNGGDADGGPGDAAVRIDGGDADGGGRDGGGTDSGPLPVDAGDDAGAPDAGGDDAGGADAGPPTRDVFLEAEDYDRTSSSDGLHAFVTDTALGGYSGAGYIISLPDSGDTCVSLSVSSCGAVTEYDFFVPEGDDYRPFFLFQADSMDDDSYHWQLDGLGVHTEHTAVETTWTWDQGAAQHNLGAGQHTLYFYMRENGFKLDAIWITTTGSPP